MTAVKSESAPSAKRSESWSVLPEEVAIYAHPPKNKVAVVEWPNPTEDDPEGVIKIKVPLVRAIDKHDETLPDFDHTFTWEIESAKAKSQIRSYVRSMAGTNVEGRLKDGVNVTSNGRRTVLLARVANAIREALGLGAGKINMRRIVISDTLASTYSIQANVVYKREPEARGRQYAKAIADRNITPEELSAEVGESAATIRRCINLSNGQASKTGQTRARKTPTKAEAQAAHDRARKSSAPAADEWAKAFEWVATGHVPADPELRRIVTGK